MSENLTIIDVTLRDGGYVNGHSWRPEDAATIVASVAAAQLSYCEVGYFRPARHHSDGIDRPAACCPPGYLRALHESNPELTLVAMVHAKDVSLADYQLLADCGVGMVRMPVQLATLPTLGPHVEAVRAAGMQVTVNLIRVSEVGIDAVAEAARTAGGFGADAFYLADSNGGLFPDQVSRLVEVAQAVAGIPLGFHAHDGLSLAFINSLTAMRAGCTYLDGSLAGMGKGGGNLALELIVGYLISRHSAPYYMAPLVRAADTALKPWKDGVAIRCDSMATGLLDLNVDRIADYRNTTDDMQLISRVDALVSR